MIKEIKFVKYRKLEGLRLRFSTGVNLISGANGTCKSSVLHLISNAYQKVKTKNNGNIVPTANLRLLNRINPGLNLKLESLTRGDKKYRDPAHGVSGDLFEVEYENGLKLGFRRHNSSSGERFSVKPRYSRGSKERLPSIPVVYLGLSRLISYGELSDDTKLEVSKIPFPEEYEAERSMLFKRLCRHEIVGGCRQQKIGSLKARDDFVTTREGIDSNTISSGEDNLVCIIKALVSLHYYYESLVLKSGCSESVLLIDELDATLHPSLQECLYELLQEYSEKYKIQIVCTTHSISLVEHALKSNGNVSYLVDNVTKTGLMPDPDSFKIKMHLRNCSRADLYSGRTIPVFSEDDEAREFLNALFNKIFSNDVPFAHLKKCFHFVDAKIGASNLGTIFADKSLPLRNIAFAVLDGDKKTDLSSNVITLPGNESPENVLVSYGEMILKEPDKGFWISPIATSNGYTPTYFFDKVKVKWDSVEEKIKKIHDKGEHATGVRRKHAKEFWAEYHDFLIALLGFWVEDTRNKKQIEMFEKDLKMMYVKTASYNGLNPNDWP